MAQRKVNCEVYTDRGIVGKNGADGKSAYQQAVEGGYQGTEEEFEQALASDISTVATNISSVNTAATNMAAIIEAPTAATNAQIWAEGTDSQVTPLGGEHSSKGWANIAKQYAESIGAALKYKGSVPTYSDLPSTGQQNGDVWNVLDTGANYAWTGTEWDKLSETVDLSGYIPTTQKGVSNGVASLDANAKVPSEQIPVATASTLGGVKVDGTTITATADGVISAQGGSGTKRSIGEVYFSQSALATDNSGALPLFTGETIASANTIYPEFYNWVLAHTELQCTSAEYEASLTTYGECAKYVIGSGSLRLPLIKNYIKAANPAEGIKNIEAGLPNITGDGGGYFSSASGNSTGAFSGQSVFGNGNVSAGSASRKAVFDASLSNQIYGKSDTVTPASTTLYPWVVAYAAAIPASTAQAAEFQQGLSGKADTNLGNVASNLDYVVESYQDDGGNWYRKYKSGWVEQGGVTPALEISTNASSVATVTFLKPFSKLYSCHVLPSSYAANVVMDFGDPLIATDSNSIWAKSILGANITADKNVKAIWYAAGQGA